MESGAEPKPLGEVIRQYRKDHRMTIRTFSEKSGISKAYIGMLEKNERPDTKKPPVPSLDKVINSARVMGMDASELLTIIGMDLATLEAENEAAHPNFQATKNPAEARKIKPFEYIPLTQENFMSAVREGRILLLPFKAPSLGNFVYVPMEEYGIPVAHTITRVDGGVYEASSEANGKITFTLFDIGVRVFMNRGAAKDAMEKSMLY